MGCDIHPHIEVKINGRWQHYSAQSMSRYYIVFERICGVRGDVSNAIAPPRGLPADPSAVTLACYNYEKPDAHSMTWLSHQELIDLIKWCDSGGHLQQAWQGEWTHQNIPYLCGNHFTTLPDGITDVRFICWFDN